LNQYGELKMCSFGHLVFNAVLITVTQIIVVNYKMLQCTFVVTGVKLCSVTGP